MTREDDLERVLDEAREASPAERLPKYRDANDASVIAP